MFPAPGAQICTHDPVDFFYFSDFNNVRVFQVFTEKYPAFYHRLENHEFPIDFLADTCYEATVRERNPVSPADPHVHHAHNNPGMKSALFL